MHAGNVSLRVRNFLAEGELRPEATVKEYLTVRTECSRQVERPVDHYNPDVIHRDEPRQDWTLARTGHVPGTVAPLE